MEDKGTATWAAALVAIAGFFGTVARWMFRGRDGAAKRSSGADSEIRRTFEAILSETRKEIMRMHEERRQDRDQIDELRRENANLEMLVSHLRSELEIVQSRLDECLGRRRPLVQSKTDSGIQGEQAPPNPDSYP